MPGPAGGGDTNKIVIELEIKVKELTNQLKEVEGKLEAHEKKLTRHRTSRKKDSKDQKKEIEGVKKAQIDLVKTHEAAAKSATRMSKAWGFIKRDVHQTGKDLKALAKHDVGKGFIGGLLRGTGVAGLYQSIRGQPGGPGFRQRLGGAIGRGAMGLASQGAGWLMGGLNQGYEKYMQFGASQWGMTGMGAGRGDIRRGKGVFGRGTAFGWTPTETAQMAPGVAAATGYLGATTTAQKFAMAGGYGPGRAGEAVQYMGTMTQAGHRWTGGGQEKSLQKTIALGMYSGLEKARLPEFYEGVRGLVQSQFGTAAGKIDSVNIARQLAMLGKSGGVGFQGQRGAQIMGQLDQMIKAPGAGEAGQAMILQAMGFGKPGGQTNYYEALKMQQKGVQDPENIKRVMKEVYSQRGVVEAGGADPRNREANLQFSMLSGLSLEQTEKLKDIYSSNKSQEEQEKEAQKVIDESKDLQTQALEATKSGFAGIKKHIAGVESQLIGIGSKIAPEMMKWQDLQLTVMKAIANYIPLAVEWLKKLWETIKEIAIMIKSAVEKFLGKDAPKVKEEWAKQFEKDIALIKSKRTRTSEEAIKKQEEIAQKSWEEGGKVVKQVREGSAWWQRWGSRTQEALGMGKGYTMQVAEAGKHKAQLEQTIATERATALKSLQYEFKQRGLTEPKGPEAEKLLGQVQTAGRGQAMDVVSMILPKLFGLAKDEAAQKAAERARVSTGKRDTDPRHRGIGTAKGKAATAH